MTIDLFDTTAPITVLMELGDFAMRRRMLTTMKRTIEHHGR